VSSIRTFKIVALAEAASYLVLLAAAVVKRTHDVEALVPIVGPIHGLLFLAYLGLALYVRERLGWNGWTTVMVVVASVLPLGGLVVERRVDDEPASVREPSTRAAAG
jgi:integral membrane protein